MNLETPLSELSWIAAPRLRQLDRLGLRTVEDLLNHFPRRYEDRTQFDRFPTEEMERPVCVCGVVKKTLVRRIRGGQKMFDVLLEEADAHALSPSLTCRWFNAHWVEKIVATGQRLVVHGRPKRSGSIITIAHPEFEVAEDDAEKSIHLDRIAPIHGGTEGLSPRAMRRLIWDTLTHIDSSMVPALLPRDTDPTTRGDALRQIHFPASFQTLTSARRHLVLTEFLAMQLCVAAKRAEIAAQPGVAHCGAGHLMKRLHESLPFALTGAQKRAIAEIAADLARAGPMNRLLHGDVGSGKTLVALSAMLLAVEAGYQAALMAPTQILAEQHYLNFRLLLEPLGVGVALRVSGRKEDTTPLPLFANAPVAAAPWGGTNGGVPILVGTHALLYEGMGINNLGLVVIDEQHKFGVLQRARLRDQAVAPDVLVMTATPIPRTLTMTVYGDLDVSTLDELPANRGSVVTAVRDQTKFAEAVNFIHAQLVAGGQAYIVYPLIDESERFEAKAAKAEFEKWQRLLAPMTCELLHGRIPAEEKEAIMERFRQGKTKALVATTVIEVGVDVPNANVMLIENAERFGLAQLHQLRGRIGRGVRKSFCILLTSKTEDPDTQEKLRVMEKTRDGFAIAEADLQLRGPGDILGTAQSGLPPLKIGDLLRDRELMQMARQRALALVAADPLLQRPENAGARRLLASGRKLTLAQVS